MDSFMIVFYRVFSFFGFILFFAVIGAGTYDALNINKNFVYANLHLTSEGLIKHGFVLDAHVTCDNKFLRLELSEIPLVYKEIEAKRISDLKVNLLCSKWEKSNISVPLKAPATATPSESSTVK